jgi:hypothetical protein
MEKCIRCNKEMKYLGGANISFKGPYEHAEIHASCLCKSSKLLCKRFSYGKKPYLKTEQIEYPSWVLPYMKNSRENYHVCIECSNILMKEKDTKYIGTC